MLSIAVLAFPLVLVVPATSHAPVLVSSGPCAQLVGNWRGAINRNNGERLDVVIAIQGNCAYVWRSPAGQVYTPGRLSQSGSALEYQNQAGSRGTVTVGPGTLEWRNIHTGNNYVVSVRRAN